MEFSKTGILVINKFQELDNGMQDYTIFFSFNGHTKLVEM